MRFPLLFFVLFFALTACTDDAPPVEDASLEGRWELVRASRNNRPTTTLDSLYYIFSPDGVLETNLLGDAQQGRYVARDDGFIETAGVRVPMTYEVRELTDSLLRLRSDYEGFQFDFVLQRGEQ